MTKYDKMIRNAIENLNNHLDIMQKWGYTDFINKRVTAKPSSFYCYSLNNALGTLISKNNKLDGILKAQAAARYAIENFGIKNLGDLANLRLQGRISSEAYHSIRPELEEIQNVSS